MDYTPIKFIFSQDNTWCLLLQLLHHSCSLEYRKFSSGQLAIEQWLSHLKENDLPVLVCLTHADRLYSECVDHDHILEPTKYKQKIME